MMIGAGIGQYYLARKIKEKGYYLVTVTLPGNQPVIEIADKVCYNDVFDKEGVLRIAQEEQIDAVISDQNDTMMPTVAYVAEHMGLPGNNTFQINSYCNKNNFRDNCDKLDIPVPRHCSMSTVALPEKLLDVPFPWVVKPADSQSSIGVAKVNNREEYLAALSKAIELSKNKSAIVEEFFKGQELVAEGFIYKGRYYLLGFADRKYFVLNNMFIPSQTIFPSIVPQPILDKIETCESKMAAYINPSFAIVHSEYLYNAETGKIRVVESALRGGGVYISSHLVPLYSGIDINDTLVDCILGNEVDMEKVMNQRNNKAAGYVCFYLPGGTVCKAEGFEEVRRFDFVKMMCVNDIKVGMQTPPLTHKGQRLGPILVTGDDRDGIEQNIEKMQDTLQILVEGEDGKTRGINWK